MRYHIFKDHLTNRSCEGSQVDDCVIIRNILDRLLDQIDEENSGRISPDSISKSGTTFNSYLFRCNQCPTMVSFERKSELSKHVRDVHPDSLTRLKCVYCSKLFETRSIVDYLAHLKTNHKQFIINDLLLNKKTFSQAKFDHNIDWSEYFDLHAAIDEENQANENNERPNRFDYFCTFFFRLLQDFWKSVQFVLIFENLSLMLSGFFKFFGGKKIN